jgi:hypothetical protein
MTKFLQYQTGCALLCYTTLDDYDSVYSCVLEESACR